MIDSVLSAIIGEGGLEPEAEEPVVLPLANLLKEWHSIEGGSKT